MPTIWSRISSWPHWRWMPLLEGLATVGRATVVEGEDEETFLGEVVEIDARARCPLIGDELGVGTAVHVDHDRIFLGGVEVIYGY